MEIIEQEHEPTPLASQVAAPQMPSGIYDQISLAAACAHEANRLYCLTIGDDSQPHWEDAPAWQTESAFKGASLIFHDPGGTTPERSHESWLAAKEADGWVYGEVKDVEAKTHPCMVPYDQLPPEQKRKDEIFGGVVRAILGLPRAGYGEFQVRSMGQTRPEVANDPQTTVPEGCCELCGKPMPEGEEMFRYHGNSGPCPSDTGESTPA